MAAVGSICQQSQSVDEVHQIGRPGPVKQLSSYRELSRLVTVEL
jgi:hypothetical protein